jgi:hypothetical protein
LQDRAMSAVTPRRGCTVSWTWSMIANAGA